MPITINRLQYFTAADIQQELSIARQTLWRWRRAGSIPQGRRYRDRHVVFTRQEVDAIRGFSNRLEPAELRDGASKVARAKSAKSNASHARIRDNTRR